MIIKYYLSTFSAFVPVTHRIFSFNASNDNNPTVKPAANAPQHTHNIALNYKVIIDINKQ